MESKLTKLKNAWDQFLMGLSNNTFLKAGIDLLTGFIESINKMTEALSGGNGLVKSIVGLVTVLGGLKIGKNLLSGILGKGLGWAGQQMGIASSPTTPKGEAPSKGDGIAEEVIPNPEAQGEKAGSSFGIGFVAGLLKKLEAGRANVSNKLQEKGIGYKGKFAKSTKKKSEKQIKK